MNRFNKHRGLEKNRNPEQNEVLLIFREADCALDRPETIPFWDRLDDT
jgi:hypothetical protein